MDGCKFSHCLNSTPSFLQTDKNGDPDEVKLDAEMEKVFAGKDREREKFDLTQFRDDENSKFSDQVYECKYKDSSLFVQ